MGRRRGYQPTWSTGMRCDAQARNFPVGRAREVGTGGMKTLRPPRAGGEVTGSPRRPLWPAVLPQESQDPVRLPHKALKREPRAFPHLVGSSPLEAASRCICPRGYMKYKELQRVSIFQSALPHALCPGANRWGALMLRSTGLPTPHWPVAGQAPLQRFSPT